MCGRYTLAVADPAAIRARFPVGETIEIRRRFNIAPGDDVLAVTADRAGVPRGELLRWGLVPSWADGPKTGLRMINARVETLASKPAFRTAIQRFRCLIIADGFYEWQRAESGPKQAFHIATAHGQPFAFAGLWSIWRPPAGGAGGRSSALTADGSADWSAAPAAIRSCTIITCRANAAVAPLHDRMPVILAREHEQAWLDATTPASVVAELLTDPPAESTVVRAVGIAVNDARYDGPECLEAPLAHGNAQAALF
jgi:putative SOS response-associated peptidase YedK